MVMSTEDQDLLVKNNELYLRTPDEFDFSQCLKFLGRSQAECLHRIEGNNWIKTIKLGGHPVIFSVSDAATSLRITPLNAVLTSAQQAELIGYLNEAFDLERDLRPFYHHFKTDPVLGSLCHNYYGLRLLGIPDLFEALSWSIIGQQINLTFAYSLKKRLVEAKGESLSLNGERYYLFPTPMAVTRVASREFSDWQFSRSKAAYLVGVASRRGLSKAPAVKRDWPLECAICNDEMSENKYRISGRRCGIAERGQESNRGR